MFCLLWFFIFHHVFSSANGALRITIDRIKYIFSSFASSTNRLVILCFFFFPSFSSPSSSFQWISVTKLHGKIPNPNENRSNWSKYCIQSADLIAIWCGFCARDCHFVYGFEVEIVCLALFCRFIVCLRKLRSILFVVVIPSSWGNSHSQLPIQ